MGLDNWPKDHLSLKALLRTKPREREKNQKPSSHSMSGNSIPPTPPSLPKKKKKLRIMFLSLVKMIRSWLIHLDIYIKYIAL